MIGLCRDGSPDLLLSLTHPINLLLEFSDFAHFQPMFCLGNIKATLLNIKATLLKAGVDYSHKQGLNLAGFASNR